MYCCDLFNISLTLLETPVDRIFDRGSYVAIEREDREKYVKQMLSLMAPTFRYLLAAVQYDPTKFEGPPRHADRQELTQFFTNPGMFWFYGFNIQCLNIYSLFISIY